MYIEPEVLIISNKFDFSTDFVTNKLNQSKVPFLRLNRDDLKDYQIELDPLIPCLKVSVDALQYRVSGERLKSIYYRAPTFLREVFQEKVSAEDQLYLSQWAAFVRSLVVFEDVKWVNSPVATYKAEMKPFQLFLANQIGFDVPRTLISNYTKPNIIAAPVIAIKSIDTAIVSDGEKEAFIYTSLIQNEDLASHNYSSPFFVQEGLVPKVDIRITIIGERVIPVKIVSQGGIPEDWRKHKGLIEYQIFQLPATVEEKCLVMARRLGLNFCAIDMILYKDKYYFIEVNPTGEWSWLQKNTGFEFAECIASLLAEN